MATIARRQAEETAARHAALTEAAQRRTEGASSSAAPPTAPGQIPSERSQTETGAAEPTTMDSEVSLNKYLRRYHEEELLEACFNLDWVEADEPRNWLKIPELKSIADMAIGGEIVKAKSALDRISRKYQDFDFVYWWGADLLVRGDRRDEARRVLASGLLQSNTKFPLCWKMATIWYQDKEILQAFVWWARAVVSQFKAKGQLVQSDPPLHLAHIAESLGVPECATKLFGAVSKISNLNRLNGDNTIKLTTMLSQHTRESVRGPMRWVLRKLCDDYIVPTPVASRAINARLDSIFDDLTSRSGKNA